MNTLLKTWIHAVLTGCLVFIFLDCVHRQPATQGDDLIINLKWNKAYPLETPDTVKTGLLWTYSFLGAALPAGSFNTAHTWIDTHTVKVDLSKLGFNAQALSAWAQLLKVLKESDEYKHTGAMDLGRFVALSVNTSRHYYAITGVKKTYNEFRSGFRFTPRHAALTHSMVSLSHRLIEIGELSQVGSIGFVAKEGTGSIKDSSFHAKEYEVCDMMPNGQLRFAIYNENGELINCSDSLISRGGKPAKCLWCHEVAINPPFFDSDSVSGYYSKDEFKTIVFEQMDIVKNFRTKLLSDLDYSKRLDHTMMELLYISFMEPSAQRIANEWNMPVEEVTKKLQSLPVHSHDEFPFMGLLYHRARVDSLAPFKTIRSPDSAREQSAYEPDLIK